MWRNPKNKHGKRDIDDARKGLEACLSHLWNGIGKGNPEKEKHICNAIVRARNCHRITYDQSVMAQDYVLYLLDGAIYLENWLIQRIDTFDGLTEKQRIYKIQATRKAWILNMIKELS